MVQDSGFRVQGLGFRVQVSWFRVQGPGYRVQGSWFRVQGSWFRVQGSGFWAYGTPVRRETKGLGQVSHNRWDNGWGGFRTLLGFRALLQSNGGCTQLPESLSGLCSLAKPRRSSACCRSRPFCSPKVYPPPPINLIRLPAYMDHRTCLECTIHG